LHFDKPNPQDIKQGVKNLDLNKLMQNVDGESFNYESFTNAYETDPQVKTMVRNFNKRGIDPETEEGSDEISQPGDNKTAGDKKVSQMAKSATDIGNDL
tara:strand:- start:130 stop:426 length:297 start_codon:yes stop_codon:yes gene_type:complete